MELRGCIGNSKNSSSTAAVSPPSATVNWQNRWHRTFLSESYLQSQQKKLSQQAALAFPRRPPLAVHPHWPKTSTWPSGSVTVNSSQPYSFARTGPTSGMCARTASRRLRTSVTRM